MFKNLDDLNWSSYTQAHGNAEHIPDAIRNLISENATERYNAYWKLDNYIVLQSDLYESAFYVIPFLIEILQSNFDLDKGKIYDLLYEIANGSAPNSMTVEYKGKLTPLQVACRLAIAGQINIYLDEIENVNSDSRVKALELVAILDECKEEILQRLQSLVLVEKDVSLVEEVRELISEFSN